MPDIPLKGHTLLHGSWVRSYTSDVGAGICSCSEVGPVVDSNEARQSWHENHKNDVRSGRGERALPYKVTGKIHHALVPRTGLVIDYASPCERNRARRLAMAAQQVARLASPAVPPWPEVDETEQELSTAEARNWLRAGLVAGLIAPCSLHDGECEAVDA